MRVVYVIALWAAISVFFQSCGSTSRIPKPTLNQVLPVPPVQTSYINLPITVDLAAALKLMEGQVPKDFDGSRDWNCEGNDCVKYAAKREKLEAHMNQNVLSAGCKVNYWVEYCKKVNALGVSGCPLLASCGDRFKDAARLNVTIQSSLSWSEDWELKSVTKAQPVQTLKECKVTFAKYDISPMVVSTIEPKLQEQVSGIDKQIAEQLAMKKRATELWAKMSQPINVYENIWLVVNPKEIAVEPIKGANQTVKTAIGIRATPKVVYSDKSPKPDSLTSLPKLKIQNQLPSGFRLEIDTEISYADATNAAQRYMNGYKYTSGKKTIVITDMELYGAGDKVVVRTKVTGSYEGDIYAVGMPYYDAQDSTVKIKDFDFSLESKNVLLKSADWILHGTLKNKIVGYLKYPIGEKIADARKAMEEALKKPLTENVQLQGQLKQMHPVGVYNTGQTLKAILVVEGDVKLRFK